MNPVELLPDDGSVLYLAYRPSLLIDYSSDQYFIAHN